VFVDKDSHLERARELLAKGGPDNLRYACLELRFCIEMLAYEQIELHEKELPEEVFRIWQPKRVIEEILLVDPDADKDSTLAIGIEGPNGEPAKEFFLLGRSWALTPRFIRANYHKLGSFLHAPSFERVRHGPFDFQPLKAFLEKLLPELERLCTSQSRHNLGMFSTFTCTECKNPVVRNTKSLKADSIVVCPKADCKARYTVEGFNTPVPLYHLIQAHYDCPACRTRNHVPQHKLEHGITIRCVKCSKRVAVRRAWEIWDPGVAPPQPA
jgi:DNA-directed RNA polymerase subunit RPC12/RpoP